MFACLDTISCLSNKNKNISIVLAGVMYSLSLPGVLEDVFHICLSISISLI